MNTTSRLRSALMGALAAGFALATFTPGCESTCEENGGVVVIDGGNEYCEEKCRPELCVEGNTCVNNRCRLVCDAHTDCFQGAEGSEVAQACVPVVTDSETGLADGAVMTICEVSPKAAAIGKTCTGEEVCAAFTACPDGTDCALGGCAPEACRPLGCRDAYCTNFDCQADSDCAPGMQCRAVRVDGTLEDCASPTGTKDKGKGQPQIPCDQIDTYNAQNGTGYQEGPQSPLRNVCVKRAACSTCVSTADCSLVEGASCIPIGGANHCAAPCPKGDECGSDYECSAGFCVPRAGACTPPQGTSSFCYPCSIDFECGPPGSLWACTPVDGANTCFDFSYSLTCSVDEDCPLAPSGVHGECLDEDELGKNSSTNPLYHRCYFPQPTPLFDDCWP